MLVNSITYFSKNSQVFSGNFCKNSQILQLNKEDGMISKLFFKLIESLYLRFNGNLVYFDQLTGCHSRFYYDNVVKQKYKDRFCNIVFVDINNLKQINDKYGHHEGTEIIKQVAANLIATDGLMDICRFGGDEFVAFANEDFDISKLNSINNISFGMYSKFASEDIVNACKKADAQMYIMKEKLKNRENKNIHINIR